MIVVNEKTLDRFREASQCELCRDRVSRCDPHHYYPRGRDNGSRLDITANLISLCRFCHRAAENGSVPRAKILGIIAAREGKTPDEIMAIINGFLMKEKQMLSIHPVAYDFPEPTPERFAEIKDSIKQFGVYRPVLVWQGQIVDGRCRKTACDELGIDCPCEVLDCDEPTAIRRAIHENSLRRDMTDDQRLMSLAKAYARLQPDGQQKREGNLIKGKIPVFSPKAPREPSEKKKSEVTEETTREELAKSAGVSRPTANRAIEVAKKSPSEVQEAVAKSEVSVKDAASVADLPADEQLDALEKVKSGKARTLKAAAKKEEDAKEEIELLWDRRGRLVFDPDCVKKYKAAKLLQEKAEEVKKTLRGVRQVEDVILESQNQGKHKVILQALWSWENYHPGMVCPVCYGTGFYSEERIDYILETVEMLKASADAKVYDRLNFLPNGEPCPYWHGAKWICGDDTHKVDEEVAFHKHCPRRTDAYRKVVA